MRVEGLITNSEFVVDYRSILGAESKPNLLNISSSLRLPHNFTKFSRESNTRIYNVTINYYFIPSVLIKILLHNITTKRSSPNSTTRNRCLVIYIKKNTKFCIIVESPWETSVSREDVEKWSGGMRRKFAGGAFDNEAVVYTGPQVRITSLSIRKGEHACTYTRLRHYKSRR